MVTNMEDLPNERTLFSLPIISVIHALSLTSFSTICLLITYILQEATTEPFTLHSNMPLSVYTKLSPEQIKDANFSFSCNVTKGESSDWYTIYLLKLTAVTSFAVLMHLKHLGEEFKTKIKLSFSPNLIRRLIRMKHLAKKKMIQCILENMECMMKLEGSYLFLQWGIFYWSPTQHPAINFNFHNERYFWYLSEFCQLANASRTVERETIYIYEIKFDGIRSYFIHRIVEPYLRIAMVITGIISFINLTKYISCYYDTMLRKVWALIPVLAKRIKQEQNNKSAANGGSFDDDIYFEAED